MMEPCGLYLEACTGICEKEELSLEVQFPGLAKTI